MPETARTIYDTHAAVRRLTEAGLPESHAEAVVREQIHLIEHDLATKADIEALRQATKADIEALRQATKADIEALRQETKAAIAAVQADVDKLRHETRAIVETAKTDIIKWVAGLNAAVALVVLAALLTVFFSTGPA